MSAIPDERLALVFTCCHPALAAESRVALTLREVGGLTTGEIARAFLVAEPAMAQRLVRAKRKIRERRDPVPRSARPPAPRAPAVGARRALPRLQRGLRGDRRLGPRPRRALRRGDPAREAPRRPHAGRAGGARTARADAPPGLAPRSARRGGRRDRAAGGPGSLALGRRAHRRGAPRPRARRLTAARRPVPAAGGDRRCTRGGSTADRRSSRCTRRSPDRAVARGRASTTPSRSRSPGDVDEGLALLDEIDGLDGYHLFHAARADLYRRLDRRDEAAEAYRRALELATSDPEIRFLERRLAEVT